jgi:hypothetical protein
MSEIRRKLVIVGDGACGKVCSLSARHHLRETAAQDFQSNIDLFVDRFLERNIPRGRYRQPLVVLGPWSAANNPQTLSRQRFILTEPFSRSMYQLFLRTMLPTLRLTASMLNSLYGIRPGRKTTIVSDPLVIQTLTSSSYVLQSTPQTRLTTSRRRYAFSSCWFLSVPNQPSLSLFF